MKATRQILHQMVEQEKADEATGIHESHERSLSALLYADDGEVVSPAKARKLFRDGEAIHDPNGGAGSFRKFLAVMGYKDVTVLDWTSSAGDWSFRIRGGVVCQHNRYPYHGFMYVLHYQE